MRSHAEKWLKAVGLLAVVVLVGAGCSAPAEVEEAVEASSLTLSQTTFEAGESITVQFEVEGEDEGKLSDSAWVGIVPSATVHGPESEIDQHDVAYQYLNGAEEGSKTFTSPGAGEWDFRLLSSDADGEELASVSFMVNAAEAMEAEPAGDAMEAEAMEEETASAYPNGTRVYAEWVSNTWYPGTVDGTCAGGFHVTYDDGDEKCASEAELTMNVVPAASSVQVGSTVLAQWVGTPYYNATVLSIEGDTYHVKYYDGVEYDVSLSQIRLP